VTPSRDEFLTDEDLGLKHLSDDEFLAYWNLWLLRAQATNDLDAALYEHGVFGTDPAPRTLNCAAATSPEW